MGKQAVVGQKVFVDARQVNIEVDADVSLPVTVELGDFRGVPNLSIRHWYQREDGQYARTQKGVTIPFDDREALLQALVDAINLGATDGSQIRLVIAKQGEPVQDLV